MLTVGEARQLAFGYAWAAEDFTHVKTACPAGEADGSSAFAEAYAEVWANYGQEKRWNTMPVQEAYKAWQASGGMTLERGGVPAAA